MKRLKTIQKSFEKNAREEFDKTAAIEYLFYSMVTNTKNNYAGKEQQKQYAAKIVELRREPDVEKAKRVLAHEKATLIGGESSVMTDSFPDGTKQIILDGMFMRYINGASPQWVQRILRFRAEKREIPEYFQEMTEKALEYQSTDHQDRGELKQELLRLLVIHAKNKMDMQEKETQQNKQKEQ